MDLFDKQLHAADDTGRCFVGGEEQAHFICLAAFTIERNVQRTVNCTAIIYSIAVDIKSHGCGTDMTDAKLCRIVKIGIL